MAKGTRGGKRAAGSSDIKTHSITLSDGTIIEMPDGVNLEIGSKTDAIGQFKYKRILGK